MISIYDIIEAAQKRREQWETIFIREFPDPYSLKETTILGTYSLTMPQSKKRIVLKPRSIKLDHFALNKPIFETPSAIARDYLGLKYKKSPTVKHIQAVRLMDGFNPMPNYVKPSSFNYGFYIDIQSAFWSIMNRVGWNPDYYPGKWLSAGTPPNDFPFPNHKIARNCLVSAGIPSKLLCYQPRGIFTEINPGNRLTNYSLYCLISDVLNSIAQMAIDHGAIYVNTDGYIAPNIKTAAKIGKIITEWGLIPSVKAEGSGEVIASGAYKVGSKTSMPYEMGVKRHRINRVFAPNYSKWLEKAFSFWSRENT